MQQLKWTVGDVRVTCIEETVIPYPWKALFPHFPETDLTPYLGWLRPTYFDNGSILMSIHSLLIESGKRRILVDTCFGRRAAELPFKLPWCHPVPEELEAAGFPINSIDTVLCTHINSDHVGGTAILRDGRLVPAFPKATYLFTRPEMEYMEADPAHDTGKLMDSYIRPIVAAGVTQLVDMDCQLTPEVRLMPSPGHTPGHVGVRIISGGHEAVYTSDLMHTPMQVLMPDIAAHPDSNADQAIASRRRILGECADSGCLVITSHFPRPTSGHVRRQEGGYRWEASK